MPRFSGFLAASMVLTPLGCTDPTIHGDLDAKAVVYGRVVTDAGDPVSGSRVYARVYQSGECGRSAPGNPIGATTDNAGAYRIFMHVLAGNPFLGCVTVSEDSTALTAPRRALLKFDSPAIDSARVDVVRAP